MNDKYKPVRKVGAFNRDKTKKWDGKKWVAVNVVHKGQRAKLNDKTVVADGKGNWRLPGTRGNSLQGTKPGKVVGSYQSGDRNRKPLKPIAASERPKDMQQGVRYGEPEKPKPTPPKPKPTSPKPKPNPIPKPKPKPSPAPKPSSATAKPTPATSSNAQNLRQGRSPDKPTSKPTKPARKKYGSKGRKDLKQSSRMAAALKSLKVKDFKRRTK